MTDRCCTDSMTSSQMRRLRSVVVDQLLVERLELRAFVGVGASGRLERRWLHEDVVLERTCRRLRSRVHSMPHRTALHEDDRMVAVLARDSRGQPQDESRLGLTRHLLEAVGRQVMAFVDDQMAVLGDAIVNDTLPDETLNDGDVEQPGRSALARRRFDRSTSPAGRGTPTAARSIGRGVDADARARAC